MQQAQGEAWQNQWQAEANLDNAALNCIVAAKHARFGHHQPYFATDFSNPVLAGSCPAIIAQFYKRQDADEAARAVQRQADAEQLATQSIVKYQAGPKPVQ